MRIITGAILIVGAIWLFTAALPYGTAYGSTSAVVTLAFILAGLTAMLGLFYLFVGSVEAREGARWYQFTVKSLLAVTAMAALFFSGRALGLREAVPSPIFPTAVYSGPLAPPPAVYATPYSTVAPLEASTSVAPVNADSFATHATGSAPAVPDSTAPRQPPTPPSATGPEKPSAPPTVPAAQTPT